MAEAKQARAALSRSAASGVGRKIVKALKTALPGARCALRHRNAYELIVSTILSAQCTDERVNLVTPGLFKRYPAAANLARANVRELEGIIHSTGFYRAKAKSLLGCCKKLIEEHGGQVPRTMNELVALPGVGRKTANVVLGTAYGISVGVVVDTHVARLSKRLGLTKEGDPTKIEQDLMRVIPRDSWIDISHLLIHHGRRTCFARKPECHKCAVNKLCPSAGKV